MGGGPAINKQISHSGRMEVKQFASGVVNFSSQYGTAGTSSYTASNLAGPLRVYDKYGDYTEAFVLVRISI